MNRRAVAGLVVAALALGGCASSGPASESPDASATPTGTDLPPWYDETPDGDVVPDSALSATDLTALLRLEATDPSGPETCGPSEVTGSITETDAAAGHRYGRVTLVNVSSRTCTLSGSFGIGARGESGNTFEIAVEHRDYSASPVAPTTVPLHPGGRAFANLEWTGELAGAESEKISLLVLQLAQGQVPLGVPAQSGGAAPIDIGILTTVRLGPVQPAS